MSAKGFYVAQEGHTVNILPPVDITGGKTAQPFSLAGYAHASILLLIGVSAAAPGAVTLNACTSAAGANPIAIPFDVFKQETAGAANDVLGGRTPVTAAGFVPAATDGIFYVIEIDAAQLPQGNPYLQLALADTANSCIASAVAILSGGRNTSDQSLTVTV
jgi:hypothetical protein